MNSLFRGFINEKNIHDRYIYTIKFKIYILCIFSIIECLFSCNVIAKQTFNYAKYTKNVNFKLYSINVTVVNILFINKSPEE